MNADSNGSTREPESQGSTIQRDIDDEFEVRRELVLELVERAGLPVMRFGDFDRVGPVRVTHVAIYTDVLWGNLKLETFREADAAKTAERIVKRVKPILEEWFDIDAFYHTFCEAYRQVAGWFPRAPAGSSESGLRIDHVYSAFVFERMRTVFAKQTKGKSAGVESYSLPEFLVDFARYLRDPDPSNDGCFINVPEPSIAQRNQAYLVPNLKDLLAAERPILEVRLVADGPM